MTLVFFIGIQDDSIFARFGGDCKTVQSVVGGLPGDAHIAAVRLDFVQCGDDSEVQLHALPGGIRVFSQCFRLALVLQRPGVPGGFVFSVQRPGVPGGFVFSVIGQSSVKRFRLAGVHLLPLVRDFHILPVQQRPGVPGGFVFSVIGQSSVKRFRLAGVHLLPLVRDFHILPVQFHGQGECVPHAGLQQIALRGDEFQRCRCFGRFRCGGRLRGSRRLGS